MRCYDINTVKNTIKEYFRLQSFRKTSDTCKIPKSTIHGWVKRFEMLIYPKRKKRSIKTMNKVYILEKITYELSKNPFHTLHTLKTSLSLPLSLSTIYRYVKNANFTIKKASWRFPPRNTIHEKKEFMRQFEKLHSQNRCIIAVDETGFVSSDVPIRGYSIKGKPLQCTKHHPRRFRFSSCMAMDTNGGFYHDVRQGSINSNSFTTFIKSLPRFPKGSIILMDNISFHKSKIVRDLLRARGLKRLFTPPYSPECNPIENLFALIKRHIRCKSIETEYSSDNVFRTHIESSIRSVVESHRSNFCKFFVMDREIREG